MTQESIISEVLLPSGFIILGLGEVSSYVERKYQNYIVPPQAGIYKVGERTPCIVNGVQYFVKSLKDNSVYNGLKDFSLLTNDNYIVDIRGNLILDNIYIRNKDTMLTQTPTVPTAGYNIAKNIIQYYVSSKNPYTKESNSVMSGIGKFLRADTDHDEIISALIDERAFFSHYQQLEAFIGKDTAHVYFYNSVGICDLAVEKTIDWRAYQWHLNQDEQTNERNHF